ncbi:MAG: hypothetical protein BV456_11340 [Thermoplasmata archaeon M8B2D]|nr:MAG: hypothetical protein BV456_11340 [Thermoplasmata archaeon M8B2D]
MTQLSLQEWIILVVAVWGAGLSTLLGILKFIENKRILKIQLSSGLIRLSSSNIPTVIMITCTNIGKRPMQITSYGLKLPDKKFLSVMQPIFPIKFPMKLSDGDSFTLHFHINDIAIGLSENGYSGKIKMKGYVGDSIGKRYFSKKMKFNIDEWV